ncbi:MAG: exo-alpha-sialidase [Proteobacteria bacterium]|nr:exo-alpha-sialidase [Pseudomonadota bacterium]
MKSSVLFAIVSIAACSSSPPQRDVAAEGRVTLARAGEAGVDTYRIPALAVTRAGTLLASYDARWDSSKDLPGNIDILLRRSLDNGRSWNAPQRIVHYGNGVGGGDSSLLVDRDTGRVFLFFTYAPRGVGLANAQAGNALDSITTMHPRYMWSDDDGLSWQGPRDLIADIKNPTWAGMFAGSGHGIQLSSDRIARGRLIQPYVFRGDNGLNAVNAYSDDHGATWRMGAPIGGGLDESKAVELADGTVMQNIRSSDARVHARLVARSQDGGIHFDAAQPDAQLPDPHDNGDIIRVAPDAMPDSAQAHWLLFSNNADAHERRKLTVRLSCDEGRTWNAGRLFVAGESMYSVLARLPDGSFGLFYEGEAGRLEFERFSLESLGQPCRD